MRLLVIIVFFIREFTLDKVHGGEEVVGLTIVLAVALRDVFQLVMVVVDGLQEAGVAFGIANRVLILVQIPGGAVAALGNLLELALHKTIRLGVVVFEVGQVGVVAKVANLNITLIFKENREIDPEVLYLVVLGQALVPGEELFGGLDEVVAVDVVEVLADVGRVDVEMDLVRDHPRVRDKQQVAFAPVAMTTPS